MFSTEEKEKIEELRKRVGDQLVTEEQKEDYFLIRWLRARSMNVDKAEGMLRKSLKWRKETGADTILERDDFPEKYRKKFMFGLFGEDKDDLPIIMLPAGRHDHKMILEAEGMEACLRWNIVWMEKITEIIRESRIRSGKPVYTFHEIIDMEHYSYKAFIHKPAVQYILETQQMFDENYPEILESITVINAPKIFAMLFALLKPFAAKETLDKVTIYGCDEESWKKVISDKFPLDKIPSRWGGTLQGSDEFCSESAWFEPPIPLNYFKKVAVEDADGYSTIKISARDKHTVEIPIVEANTKIEWKFRTEQQDIGYQVLFCKDASQDEEVIVPMKRVDSHKVEWQGSTVIKSKGICKFFFDNRYSLTKSKTLIYRIEAALVE